MKKTDMKRFNSYASNMADGLDFAEAEQLRKDGARSRSREKARDWLQVQEAELRDLSRHTAQTLRETFDMVGNDLNATMQTIKKNHQGRLGKVLAQDMPMAA